jgi:hypothetical protein
MPDVNKQHQALLINVVSIHHHCPSSFVMTTGKVFFIVGLRIETGLYYGSSDPDGVRERLLLLL